MDRLNIRNDFFSLKIWVLWW